MSITVSFDSAMTRDVEVLAAKNGLTAAEYITRLVAEAIEDAHDYDRCARIVEEHEKNPQSYTHDPLNIRGRLTRTWWAVRIRASTERR